MQTGLDPEYLAFREAIEQFVNRHWRGAAASAWQHWSAALVDAGWSVPHWPVAHGGTEWDAVQQYLWYQACAAAGVCVDFDAGAERVGPLLLAQGSRQQQTQWLPGIRSLTEYWSMALAEPHCGYERDALQCRATAVADGWRLDGEKCWVLGTLRAHWLCCYAQLSDGSPTPAVGAFFAVPMSAAGVQCVVRESFDGGERLADVSLRDVHLDTSALLARDADGTLYAQSMTASQRSLLGQSAQARRYLKELDEQLVTLDPDDPLQHERAAVAIDLQALEALEWRLVDAWQQRRPSPIPLSLMRLRGGEILRQLGALQVESFGYYALPYALDEGLHNEGPIGPETAARAIRQSLADRVQMLHEDDAEALRDAAWPELQHEL